jgi:acetoin utilization deacetylase AcuC-like enzyme
MEIKHKTGIVFDNCFLDHNALFEHPERAARLEAIKGVLDTTNVYEKLIKIPSRMADLEEISLTHSPDYVKKIEALLSTGKSGFLDMGDTFYSSGTKEASFKACAGSIDIALACLSDDIKGGIVIPRPPGHHAEYDVAMGFCIFNNIAVAAKALLETGVKRIAIVDFDVHHGNGTQHLFEDDPRVLYCSIHQSPLFPGTGAVTETGTGKGKGYTINIPVTHMGSDADWHYGLNELIIPAIKEYNPDIILLSAGYDGHMNDDISSQTLTDDGYISMSSILVKTADEVCDGKILVYLEGGYELRSLATGVYNMIKVMALREYKIQNFGEPSESVVKTVEKSKSLLKPIWKSL